MCPGTPGRDGLCPPPRPSQRRATNPPVVRCCVQKQAAATEQQQDEQQGTNNAALCPALCAALCLALALAAAHGVRTTTAPPGAVPQILKPPGGLWPGSSERSEPPPDRDRRALPPPTGGSGGGESHLQPWPTKPGWRGDLATMAESVGRDGRGACGCPGWGRSRHRGAPASPVTGPTAKPEAWPGAGSAVLASKPRG